MNPNEVGNFNNYDDEGGNIAQNQTETLEFKNLEIDRYLRKLEELTLKLKEKEKLKEVESLQTEIFTTASVMEVFTLQSEINSTS